MAINKYTREEMAELTKDFAYGNELGEHADSWAADYDYDSDLDAEEAVRDAVVEGVRWALSHLKNC